MKSVIVHLHAGLGRKRPGAAGRHPVRTAAATVGELLAELDITETEAAMVFVNGKRAAPQSAIRDGDEVRVFPLVGGG